MIAFDKMTKSASQMAHVSAKEFKESVHEYKRRASEVVSTMYANKEYVEDLLSRSVFSEDFMSFMASTALSCMNMEPYLDSAETIMMDSKLIEHIPEPDKDDEIFPPFPVTLIKFSEPVVFGFKFRAAGVLVIDDALNPNQVGYLGDDDKEPENLFVLNEDGNLSVLIAILLGVDGFSFTVTWQRHLGERYIWDRDPDDPLIIEPVNKVERILSWLISPAVTYEELVPPRRINERRERKGKKPFETYKYVHIRKDIVKAMSEGVGTGRKCTVLHRVRAHKRVLPSGKVVRVRAHYRGLDNLVEQKHIYVAEAKENS